MVMKRSWLVKVSAIAENLRAVEIDGTAVGVNAGNAAERGTIGVVKCA